MKMRPAVALATAVMDRQAFELQEDLDLVVRELDAQLLVPMDVRGAVVIPVDVHVAVRVQCRLFPFAAVEVSERQRLERGFLDRLEALAARDPEARVATLIDLLHAVGQCAVDLRQGGEAAPPIAEARVAHEDIDQSLDDGFIVSQQLQLVQPHQHP
jgi:hypothetical protein